MAVSAKVHKSKFNFMLPYLLQHTFSYNVQYNFLRVHETFHVSKEPARFVIMICESKFLTKIILQINIENHGFKQKCTQSQSQLRMHCKYLLLNSTNIKF